MDRPRLLALVALFTSAFFFAMPTRAQSTPERGLVHLMSYLAADYSGAVKDGKVLSQFEYDEQKEFAQSAVELGQKLAASFPGDEARSIRNDVQKLQRLIDSKADPAEVEALARELGRRVIQVSGMALAPARWPKPARGRDIYIQQCAQCHGQGGRGDGAQGVGMEPAPANFWDQERMPDLSPFQAYNTIALGVNGTGMPPFSETLSDEEIWDAAFYVIGLRHTAVSARPAYPTERLREKISLEDVATLGDRELAQKIGRDLGLSEEEAMGGVVLLRTGEVPPQDPPGKGGEFDLGMVREYLGQAHKAYTEGKRDEAQQQAMDAYLLGLEPLEPKIRALDAAQLVRAEEAMAKFRQALKSDDIPSVEAAYQSATEVLGEIERLWENSTRGAWTTFLIAGGVMLREGLEAVLIVSIILTVVQATGVGRRGLAWIHVGWIAAVLLGVLGWFFTGLLLEGLERELMEGVAALVAVAALLYMGVWLHGKSEIDKWKSYVQGKAQQAMTTGRLAGLAAISFVATFREAFESVIFLRALWIDGQAESNRAILFGVLAALGPALGVAFLIIRFGRRLPLGRLFSASAVLMMALAIILTGQGVRALQQIDYVGINLLPSLPRIDFLGFYPSWQTILSQVAVGLGAWALWRYSARKAA